MNQIQSNHTVVQAEYIQAQAEYIQPHAEYEDLPSYTKEEDKDPKLCLGFCTPDDYKNFALRNKYFKAYGSLDGAYKNHPRLEFAKDTITLVADCPRLILGGTGTLLFGTVGLLVSICELPWSGSDDLELSIWLLSSGAISIAGGVATPVCRLANIASRVHASTIGKRREPTAIACAREENS